jgi:Family of unknown function (DUF6459)
MLGDRTARGVRRKCHWLRVQLSRGLRRRRRRRPAKPAVSGQAVSGQAVSGQAVSDQAQSAPPGGPMPPSRRVSPGEPRQVSLRSADRTVLPLVPGPPPPARPRPLPDATAVRLSAVPDSAPPYDDVAPGKALPRSQGVEATPDGPRPAGPTPDGPTPDGPRPAGPRPAGPRPAGPRPDGPQPDAPPEPSGTRPLPPDRAAWPSQFAQVLAETLAGSRPRRQIRPWATDQALRRIRQLGPMLAAPAGGVQPRVRRVVTSRPAAGVVEMTVIVSVGPSFRALAVRLERDGPGRARPGRTDHGRTPQPASWVCTAIEAA